MQLILFCNVYAINYSWELDKQSVRFFLSSLSTFNEKRCLAITRHDKMQQLL